MSFRVYTGNHLESLVKRLATVLREHRDPLVPETVVVLNPGMAVWLRQKLAEGAWGVCCNLDCPILARFWDGLLGGVVRGGLSAFDPEVLVWRIMKHLDRVTQPDVIAYLVADKGQALRKYQLACQLAGLFDRYQIYRPDMVAAWSTGKAWRPTIAPPANDAVAASDSLQQWQLELWQQLRREIGEPSPAERCMQFLAGALQIAETTLPLGRVSVFGVRVMPPLFVRLFRKLGETVEVNFLHLNPSPDYWAENLSEKAAANWNRRHPGKLARTAVGNPLLAGFGKAGQSLLADLLEDDAFVNQAEELFAEPQATTLLGGVQRDVFENREKPDPVKHDAADLSLRINVCHSPRREVEVLKDEILALFDRDKTLLPRDVLVMAPDISQYAPFIDAVFGRDADEGAAANPGEPAPAGAKADYEPDQEPVQRRRAIPYTIADRPHVEESELVAAFRALLELGAGRLKASEVLDLLAAGPLRRAFGFDEDAVGRIREWVTTAGIRWGQDADHRHALAGVSFEQNTWKAGRRRLALSYAWGDGGEAVVDLGGLKLVSGVTIGDAWAETLGQFGVFLDRLFAVAEFTRRSQRAADWVQQLGLVLDGFFAPEDEQWQDRYAIANAIARLARLAEATGQEAALLPVEVIQAHFDSALRQGAGVSRFLRGEMTFCRIQPLRNIPARVICLLGLGDGEYPRKEPRLSFDLLAHWPLRGDRNAREEECQLFLDAILSARDCLRLSYVGRSERDNSVMPPCAVLGELRGYLLEKLGGGEPAVVEGRTAAAFERVHRLQAFNPEYFGGGAGPVAGPVSYDGHAAAAARALRAPGERQAVKPWIDLGPLTIADTGRARYQVLDVRQLVGFLADPAKFWVREILGVRLADGEPGVDDEEPFDLGNHLAVYNVKAELVERVLNGQQPDFAGHLERLRLKGALPVGCGGEACYRDEVQGAMTDFLKELAARLQQAVPAPVAVNLTLGAHRLTGRIESVFRPAGDARRQVIARPAAMKLKDHIRLAVQHLVLCCQEQDTAWVSEFLAFDRGNPVVFALQPMLAKDAAASLQALLDGWFLPGLAQPPYLVADKTSLVCLQAEPAPAADPEETKKLAQAVQEAYCGSARTPFGDVQQPYNRLVFGPEVNTERVQACAQALLSVLDRRFWVSGAGGPGR